MLQTLSPTMVISGTTELSLRYILYKLKVLDLHLLNAALIS